MGWLDRTLARPKRALVRRAMAGTPQEAALRAQAMCQMGRPDSAIALLEPAIASSPESEVLYEAAAIAYNRLERYEDAIAAAQRSVALAPTSAKANMLLSFAFNAANRHSEALGPALAAVRLEPDLSGAHLAAGEAFRCCGERVQAMQRAQEAVRLNPDRHPALMGRVLILHERWSEAESWLRRASVTYAEAWDACFYLALTLIPQGRSEEAKATAEAYLAKHPDDKIVPLLWERLEHWRRREAELLELIDDPTAAGAPAARVELASLLVAQDRPAAAEEVLARGIETSPHDVSIRAALNDVESRLERQRSGDQSAPPAMATLERELRDEYHRRRTASSADAIEQDVPRAIIRAPKPAMPS